MSGFTNGAGKSRQVGKEPQNAGQGEKVVVKVIKTKISVDPPPTPPTLFPQYGMESKDMLTKGFNPSMNMVSVSKATPVGINLTTTATKVEDIFVGMVTTTISSTKGATVQLSTGTLGEVQGEVLFDKFAPSILTSVRGTYPRAKSGIAEVKYQGQHAAVVSTLGLHGRPVAETSASLGGFSGFARGLSVGAEVAYDFDTQEFAKSNAGWEVRSDDLTATAVMGLSSNKPALDVSLLQHVDPTMSLAVNVTHNFGLKPNLITYGGHYRLDEKTLIKGRFETTGVASALLQHEFKPLSILSVCAELDTSNLLKASPKFGFSLSIAQ